MSRLGEVLEVMYESHRRYRTFRAAGWTSGESSWRFWWAGPTLVRTEQDRPEGSLIIVRAGPRWWIREPDGTAHTNEGDDSIRVGLGAGLELLHSRELLGAAVLRFVREDAVATRPAAVLACRLRASERWRWWSHFDGPFEVAVDLERGVVLRRPSMEVTECAFDEDFPEELFAAPYGPDHHPVRRTTDRRRDLSLEEAATAVSFPVLLPALLPEGARLLRCLVDGDDPPGWMGMSWTIDPGHRYSLHVRQGPDVAREAGSGDWETLEQEGQTIRLRRHSMESSRTFEVLLERDGSWAHIDSDLPLDLVLGVALSLRPSS